MKPSQAFGVVVRSLGLLAWIAAIAYAVSSALAFFWPTYRSGLSPWWHYLLGVVEFGILGTVLVRKAEWLVRLAYRPSKSGAPDV
jgi:hypothetical protein